MPLSKVGFNATGVQNIVVPEFNITGNTTKLVNDIPLKANQYTNGFLGLAVLIVLFFYLYYKLADVAETGFFRYSQIRSITISCGIAGIVGSVMYSIGYFIQLYPILFFLIIFMIGFVWVIKEERTG